MNIHWLLLSFFFLIIAIALLAYRFRHWYATLKKSSQLKINTEDVLKELFNISDKEKSLSNQELSERLKLSPQKTQHTLQKMLESGLVQLQNEYYKLTSEGMHYAINVVRTHRLYEHYLAEKTGYAPTEWHKQAEYMEHRLTENQLSQIINEVGNPRFDPHGDPIPTERGTLKKSNFPTLNTLEAGTVGQIIHIEDEPLVVYKQILAQNIHIGSIIKILENNNQRISFYSEGEEFVLIPEIAANISVLTNINSPVENEKVIRLSALKKGEKAIVHSISQECRGVARRRLLDLGFVKGSEVSIQMESPMKNPKAYAVRGSIIALRDDQAKHILVIKKHIFLANENNGLQHMPSKLTSKPQTFGRTNPTFRFCDSPSRKP